MGPFASGANIMDKIITATCLFSTQSGLKASTVYLGESEMEELRAYIEKLKAMTNFIADPDDGARAYGCKIVEVKKERYFEVG